MKLKQPTIIGLIILIGLQSCEITTNTTNNNYSSVNEIAIPTDSPRGLAFDGEYLWYSDDSDQSLYKLSYDGKILESIDLKDCRITGFEFNRDNIWCINDTTVLYDTTISHYPYSCVFKYSKSGERLDSILIQASVNPQGPELLGITIIDSLIIISTSQGWSSGLYGIEVANEEMTLLGYSYLTGLTTQNDTVYAIDRSNISVNQVVCFDSVFNKVLDRSFNIPYSASDLAFAMNELWICDRENKVVRKIN